MEIKAVIWPKSGKEIWAVRTEHSPTVLDPHHAHLHYFLYGGLKSQERRARQRVNVTLWTVTSACDIRVGNKGPIVAHLPSRDEQLSCARCHEGLDPHGFIPLWQSFVPGYEYWRHH